MTQTAIEQIKYTEEQAKQLIAKAQEEAQKIIKKTNQEGQEALADATYANKDEVEKLLATAKQEIATIKTHHERSVEKQLTAIDRIDKKTIDTAAQHVIRRITETK